ncbi:hypothetical protein [Zooshikella sp. RANM57]|uniref:hypothetical protein n=1 Tax=Zooshikella sp. RANM57 TaxID=3425863 RepID=UPI003D6E428D
MSSKVIQLTYSYSQLALEVLINGIPFFLEHDSESGTFSTSINDYLIKGMNELSFVCRPHWVNRKKGIADIRKVDFAIEGNLQIGNKGASAGKLISEFSYSPTDGEYDEELNAIVIKKSFEADVYDIQPWLNKLEIFEEETHEDFLDIAHKILSIFETNLSDMIESDVDKFMRFFSVSNLITIDAKGYDKEFFLEQSKSAAESLVKNKLKKTEILPRELVVKKYLDDKYIKLIIKPDMSEDINKKIKLDEGEETIPLINLEGGGTININIVKINGEYFQFI